MKTISRIALSLLLTISLFAATYICFSAIRAKNCNNEKLWLHRCNTLEKLAKNNYTCFEIDVYVKSNNSLIVEHDEYECSDLPVEEYFRWLSEHQQSKMWMDVKNLTEQNINPFIQLIDSLETVYSVDADRLIIESPQWQLLDKKTHDWKGATVSYYFLAAHPLDLSPQQKAEEIQRLRNIIGSGCVDAISFPWYWYDIIHELPDRPEIKRLTWFHNDTKFEFFLKRDAKKLLKDPRLQIILLKGRS